MKQSFNRKSLLMPLLLLATGSAWAGWEGVGTNDDGATIYVDRATIRKDGNLRRMWMLTDFKQRDKNGVMSMRQMNEYDCKSERGKLLAQSEHDKPMTGGKVLVGSGVVHGGWYEIPPGTVAEGMLKIVCAQ